MPHRGARYILFQLDLAAARVNEPFDIAGGFLFIRAASAAGADITIRFDDPTASAIPFKKGDHAELQFRTLYISNTAQAGLTLDILVTESGEEFRYELATEISTISLIDTLTTIVDPVDILDRSARLLGVLDGIINPVNISDRAARVLGIVNSITNPVDIADRVARLLGVVDGITNPVDAKIVASAGQFDQVGADGNAVSNPSAGQIIATSGDLPAGLYEFDLQVHAGITTNSTMVLAWRDSSDVIKEETKFVLGEDRFMTFYTKINMVLNDDLVFEAKAFTGSVGCWISWRRRKA